MSRPHAAAQAEDFVNRWNARRRIRHGWGTTTIAYPGYGTTSQIRVLARVLIARPEAGSATSGAYGGLRNMDMERRGWRAFITTPAVAEPVTIHVGGRQFSGESDRSGVIDLSLEVQLEPGWHEIKISTPRGPDALGRVQVMAPDQTFGIISDIDDTIITTWLPRPVLAAWNAFVRVEGRRRAVPGMATLYRELLAAHPGALLVYVSTGPWNAVPGLRRFLHRSGFPPGAMLMTEWGPTNSGWFRSGAEHKRAELARLSEELPQVQWVLFGDDGQHDETLYGEFAAARPRAVRAICLRILTPSEQFLSHFTPLAARGFDPLRGAPSLPVVRGSDGYAIAPLLRSVLGMEAPMRPILRGAITRPRVTRWKDDPGD